MAALAGSHGPKIRLVAKLTITATAIIVTAPPKENNLTLLGNDVDGAQGGITGGCGATPEVAGGLYYCIKP